VKLLEEKAEPTDHFHQTATQGFPPRPVYQQIATALHVLGSDGSSIERHRIHLDLGHGSVMKYTQRTIDLLATMVPDVVRWPTSQQRRETRLRRKAAGELFYACVGFVDGSEIPLRDKPEVDWESYFSRKKNYGFNLQVYLLHIKIQISDYSLARVGNLRLGSEDHLRSHWLHS